MYGTSNRSNQSQCSELLLCEKQNVIRSHLAAFISSIFAVHFQESIKRDAKDVKCCLPINLCE